MTWRDTLEIGLKENALARKAELGAAGGESRGCSEDMSQEQHGPGRGAHRLIAARTLSSWRCVTTPSSPGPTRFRPGD